MTAATGPGLGKLSLSYASTTVTFQYNPASVKFSKSQITNSKGTIQETQEQAVTNVKAVTFNIDDLRMEGAKALKDIKSLLDWLVMLPGPPSPAGGKGGKGGKGDNQRGTPKTVSLKMGTGAGFSAGDGLSCTVILTKVDVTYTRFDSSGDPVRAKVNLQLELYEKPPKGTNPTSFSPAGGKMHVTTAGDNLQRIAYGTYADPNAWRDVAEANDIDDPLRMRNGRTLFLPYSRADGRR